MKNGEADENPVDLWEKRVKSPMPYPDYLRDRIRHAMSRENKRFSPEPVRHGIWPGRYRIHWTI